ncbi:hypothetical protein [Desulfonatronovibrio magnus]|uniref:hypothetical protein n=1 Tax=Desulfonatronovibrio magnus TaxID=698827 RepID=UPI0005EB1B76|nr:hypothetical protein [Desulfonatronovibrio magnus]
MSSKKMTFQDILKSMPKKDEPDNPFKVLEGSSVRKIPFESWQERMFFYGGCDRRLRKFTGSFPATLRKNQTTHPVFILKKTTSQSFMTCPCTSVCDNEMIYIKAHCPLDMTGAELDRNSYIVRKYTFNLSPDPGFHRKLNLAGIVPEKCLSKSLG